MKWVHHTTARDTAANIHFTYIDFLQDTVRKGREVARKSLTRLKLGISLCPWSLKYFTVLRGIDLIRDITDRRK